MPSDLQNFPAIQGWVTAAGVSGVIIADEAISTYHTKWWFLQSWIVMCLITILTLGTGLSLENGTYPESLIHTITPKYNKLVVPSSFILLSYF